ncbi:MAG TPA: hypothetical protein VL026_03195 [Rhizomicrobium sp.]|nr:hypothetical protein [Rhizomicrobium sp.]
MRLAKLLCASATVALLTGAAYAQSQTSAPSSPAEQAQTQSLNANAQAGMVNPADQARYEEQQNQYLQQQQEYQNQRADYAAQKARYNRQRAHYASQRAAYYAETATDAEAVPTAPPPYPDEANLNRLYVIADPVSELSRAPLVDGQGKWVGRVREVQTTNGFADRLKVYLYRDHRYVWLRPSMLRYDAANGVLFTPLDFRALRSMPRASA